MEYRDYYATLGVPRDASQADIRKAFRKLARQHHPDANKGDAAAERRFKEISEAHEVLADPQKRKAYDALGRDWQAWQRAGASGAWGSASASPGAFAGFGAQGFDARGFPGGVRFEYRGDPEELAGFSDFFRTFFGGGVSAPADERRVRGRGRAGGASGSIDLDALFQEARAGGSGARRAGSASTSSPTHAAAETEIDLNEVLTGTQRRVRVGEKTLEVTIPAGVEDRQRIRLSGKSAGGGNLYLTVRVRPHPVFVRSGADLTRELPITLGEALLGAEVEVPTLSGRTLLLRIPPGTQSGRLFRLSGQGLPRFRAEGRGDLLVRAKVVLPAALDEEGRRLTQALVDHIDQPDPRRPAATGPRH